MGEHFTRREAAGTTKTRRHAIDSSETDLRDTNALIFVFLTNNALVSLDAAGQQARRLARMRSSVAAQPRCAPSCFSRLRGPGYNHRASMPLAAGTRLGPYEIISKFQIPNS
jgi:hypothetical protein